MTGWKRLLLVFGAGAWAIAGHAEPLKGPGLTAQDYADIQRLYAQYGHGFDSKADDGQLYGDVFTNDGVFEDQFDRWTYGRDALLVQYGHTRTGRPNPISNSHSTWNVLIDPAPWGAVGRAYKSMGVAFGPDGQPRGAGVPGVYFD